MELSQKQLRQLLLGASFFSTGGGGSFEEGLEVINRIKKITLIDVDHAQPEKLCATAYLVGSINPPSTDELPFKNKMIFKNSADLVIEAFQYLQQKLGRKIDYIVPVELGGYNTAVSFYLADKIKCPVLDADLTGRSAPEMFQTSYFVGKIPPSPAGAATIFGEKFLIEEVVDYQRFDDFLRSLVVITFGYDVGVANFPLPVHEAKPYLLKKTLSLCIEVGELLKEGKVREAIKRVNGEIIFSGKLKKERYKEENGFTKGIVILEKGTKRLRLEYKNEILVSYIDGKQIASVPDLIGVVTVTGKPVVNTQYPEEQELIVYKIPAPSIWKTPEGLEVFSLKHFEDPINQKNNSE